MLEIIIMAFDEPDDTDDVVIDDDYDFIEELSDWLEAIG